MIQTAPSLLSADFSRLKQEVIEIEQAGADWLHLDVMDGMFVPNITFGPAVIQAIRPFTKLPFDVHLMIEEPDRYVESFVRAGADLISVHVEACRHLHRTITRIKELGVQVGVALNPATPISMIEPIITELDYILLMTVNPGFGGQAFIPLVLPKIENLHRLLIDYKLEHVKIQVDGGIDEKTAQQVVKAGANVLVAGSAIFGQKNRTLAIQKIRNANGGTR
jgi:ribulose-phosphate 3-epimerase